MNPTGNIKQPEGNVLLFKPNGKTGDIISAIKYADAQGAEMVEDFALPLLAEDKLHTYYNIWNCVHSCIPYVEDPNGKQLVQLPTELYDNRKKELGGTGLGGDCKSMALFISSCLRALGIYDFKYRFTSESNNGEFHHVYIIAECEGCYVPIDATLDTFAEEAGFRKHHDMAPVKSASNSAKVAGIGKSRIGDLDSNPTLHPTTSTTQTQLEADQAGHWEEEYNYWKKNILTINADLITRSRIGIAYANGQTKPTGKCDSSTHAIKCKATLDAVRKNWDGFLAYGSCLIYKYWNDKSNIAYTACRRSMSEIADIPFPIEYADKKQTSFDFYFDLKAIGFRDGDIDLLCNVGIWYKYGITLDYMLYRCYCLQLYGQPFKPKPGVPFYDIRTGNTDSNGVSLDVFIPWAKVFPAQGGIGRPFGQPYWSKDGFIISNGASAEEVNAWSKLPQNAAPGTVLPNGQVVPGIVIQDTVTTIEEHQRGLDLYNQWRKGNMVVLPQPNTSTIRNREGATTTANSNTSTVRNRTGVNSSYVGYVPIAEIVGIVVAIIAVVASVCTAIAHLISAAKRDKTGSQVPLPTQDFKWEHDTVDGCYIAANTTPGSTSRHVKICNGVIVDNNPDLNAAQNQAPDQGNSFFNPSPQTRKRMVWVGAGLALLGLGMLLMPNQKQHKNAA